MSRLRMSRYTTDYITSLDPSVMVRILDTNEVSILTRAPEFFGTVVLERHYHSSDSTKTSVSARIPAHGGSPPTDGLAFPGASGVW